MSSEQTQWYRLEMLVDQSDAESASALLWSGGALGVEVQDRDTFMEGGAIAPVPDGRTRLIAFFELEEGTAPASACDLTALISLGAAGIEGEVVAFGEYTDRSWETAWKDYFKPLRIAPRVVVGPPWEQFEAPEGGVKLVIEPGMAFGTGTHETTQLCTQLLDDLLGHSADVTLSVLDVGCGSGILAMAAELLGAAPVVGIDNDPLAIEVATTNLEVNDLVGRIELSTTPVGDVPGTFDIVVANILPHVLLELRDALIARVTPGGALILSGINSDKTDEVVAGFTTPEWRLVQTRQAGDWVALEFENVVEP